MGVAIPRGDVALVAGIILSRGESHDSVLGELQNLWGEIVLSGDILDFTFSAYYEKEMGPSLKRQFIAFAKPVRADSLAEAKLASNLLEKRLSRGGRRIVNVDPGHLDMSKVVVASTKDATYRIYLGEGIYSQPMLYYQGGSYQPWPWTYPDYRIPSSISFFNRVREYYRRNSGGNSN